VTNGAAVLFSLAMVIPIWRRFGTSYGAYVLLATVIPFSTALLSNLRYSVVLFPIPMMLAVWAGRSRHVHHAILIVFCVLYTFFIVLFAQNLYFE
jgi:hypothetical protein